MQTLAKEWWCVGIHPVTGQETDEGTAPAGSLVRNVQSFADGRYGDTPTWIADLSTDGGLTWWPQRSPAQPTAVPTESNSGAMCRMAREEIASWM